MLLPIVSRGPGLFLQRSGLSLTSTFRRSMAKELLIYSSEVAVFDPTLKRSPHRLAHQAKVAMEAENEELRRRVEMREADNISCALPYIYGGATLVQRGQTEAASEVVELESPENDGNFAAEKKQDEDFVFPYAITHKTSWPKLTKIAESSAESKKIVGRRRRRKNTRYRMTLRAMAEADMSPDEPEFAPAQGYEVIEGLDDEEGGSRQKRLSDDEIFRFGTADPEIAASKVPCGGCGAHLHCQDAKTPGFVPVELFRDKSEKKLRNLLCQRCHVIKEYNIALKMNVDPEDYPKTIAHVHSTRAIILLVVDLLDFPGSVWPNILEILGPHKKIILIGNKVDLLPQDSTNYFGGSRTA